ncbi:DUF480 domain-containing protein [Geothermobacter hydrogeniphilus]|uniref:DUF480 domain-containing protein n=1 Tax=Geothermobacter hydrogeniphilus TaxID=1969733 RepID=A0A2K2H8K2_9BACT|nr:YceH family protein [Geothermobacter hydrogeniphilus]PNU19644.1 DUF480 domain-containing protein [Geothermobacter hydrogeniphilus]
MLRQLNPIEIRVLGCLAEKELATPDYYPLSLNALINACNQKSNRDPLMQLNEEDVAEAIETLRPLGLVMLSGDGGRVAKYAHNLDGKFNLVPAELAVLTELLLRGAQTPGELRQRASRMHPFTTLAEIEAVINELLDREVPLLTRLPRQPGRKEQRLTQLLAGKPDIEPEPTTDAPAVLQAHNSRQRIDNLEQQLADLRRELDELRSDFTAFRRQFE